MDENIIDFTKTPLPEIYGENCFNDALMRERLPKSIYKELKEVQKGTKELSLEIAEVVASTMKDWAIEKGGNPFYSLVPAYDRPDSRKARFFYQSYR